MPDRVHTGSQQVKQLNKMTNRKRKTTKNETPQNEIQKMEIAETTTLG